MLPMAPHPGQRTSACHRLFFKQELLSATTFAFKQNSTHPINAGKDDSFLDRDELKVIPFGDLYMLIKKP